MMSGQAVSPPIFKDELRSRGKNNMLIKLIALLQITWFGFQTLARVILHCQITALKLPTVAFVVCSIFICIFTGTNRKTMSILS